MEGIEGDLFSDPSIPWDSFIKQASDLASKAVQVRRILTLNVMQLLVLLSIEMELI
jgi:hypothetical protein